MQNDSSILKIISTTFLVLLFPLFANASTLYLLPQSQDVYSDGTFVADVWVDTEGKSINAIDAALEYPKNLIDVIDISDGNSIISFWIEKPRNEDSKERIIFIGGTPKGFSGQGIIFRIIFKSKPDSHGSGELGFSDETKVLLNDGSGTEDTMKLISGDFNIVKKPADLPFIISKTHPDQNMWYRNRILDLHWDLQNGAEYSYLLSKDPIAEVDEIKDAPEGNMAWMGDMSYNGLSDGIYYFHLKQKLSGKSWSEKITFRAMIDATGPEKFIPEITEIEGKKYLIFNAPDSASGISRYEVKEERTRNLIEKLFRKADNRDFEEGQSPYLLRDQSLASEIIIKATDKAGNEQVAKLSSLEKPDNDKNLMAVFLVFMMIVILVATFLFGKKLYCSR